MEVEGRSINIESEAYNGLLQEVVDGEKILFAASLETGLLLKFAIAVGVGTVFIDLLLQYLLWGSEVGLVTTKYFAVLTCIGYVIKFADYDVKLILNVYW